MLIRKNTKAFKTILEIVSACKGRADREKLIRLYITRAGQKIEDRIQVEGIQGEAELFYEMNYQAVLNKLTSSNHQLNESDDVPGIYYFHSPSNKTWDETPFEFDEAIKKEFASLPDLPTVRKKEKTEKFVIPAAKLKREPPAPKKKSGKDQKAAPMKIVRHEPEAKQPRYGLRHKISFTDLNKVIYRQPQLTKQDILDYYHKVSEYILPYLKDRVLSVRPQSDIARAAVELTPEALYKNKEDERQDWLHTSTIGKEKKEILLCNDEEHLLLYVELGCLEFQISASRIKVPENPDHIVIAIDSPESDLAKAIDVAVVAKVVLDGLELPSFIKTDGGSGLHIYIPLDSKSDSESCSSAAEFICKLIALKIPDRVALAGADTYAYGKVSLNFSSNGTGTIVAPYSLVPGSTPLVATPLLWDEVNEGFRTEDFNHETIFKRLKQTGDPFETFTKKKINAETLLERLESNYRFLF